jgi:hypothetical protein
LAPRWTRNRPEGHTIFNSAKGKNGLAVGDLRPLARLSRQKNKRNPSEEAISNAFVPFYMPAPVMRAGISPATAAPDAGV